MSASQRRVAIIPGSFDPLTLGHLDLIRRASGLFDEVVVAVLENQSKQPWFDGEARLVMVRGACADLQNVSAIRFSGLLVEAVDRAGARVVVRGVRGGADLEYETVLARMNSHLRPGLETVFLPSAPELTHIASRLVREIAYLGGSVEGLVSAPIADAVRQRAAEKRAQKESGIAS